MLPLEWEVPETIRARVGARTAGRQRAIEAEGHLLLVLHRAPGPDEHERRAAFFWRDPAGLWRSSPEPGGLSALRAHLREYGAAEDRLEVRQRRATSARDWFGVLQEVAPLRRATRHTHAALQRAREAASDDRDLIELRDEAGGVERSMEIFYLDARNALDFQLASSAEEQARIGEESLRTGHRLNILAALFFPLTALSSVFGMNLPLGTEGAPVWVTAMVVASGIALGFAMLWWVTGRWPQRDRKPDPGATAAVRGRRPSPDPSTRMAPAES